MIWNLKRSGHPSQYAQSILLPFTKNMNPRETEQWKTPKEPIKSYVQKQE